MLSILPPAGGQVKADRSPRQAALLQASLAMGERLWDEETALLWSPGTGEAVSARQHGVRNSLWYALGLLQRGKAGDQARAERIIAAVLAQQYLGTHQPWEGTYRRAPEEAPPETVGAKVWETYDPNWRQFIGTTLALMLIDHGTQLPPELQNRMLHSIRLAVEGELAQGRLKPSYTNIALMHGFLWTFAGERLGRSDWVAAGERWCGQVRALYLPHETFEEYNSPTYYGVDLFGLALWRSHGVTAEIRTWGAELEAGLWRDIGRFYHAGMRNLCGPFDRSYGMDMRRYVALTGLWIALAVDASEAPMPDPSGPMQHGHDFLCLPTYLPLGVCVPADVRPALSRFQGERTLLRPIGDGRSASAWLSARLMIGGEQTGLARGAGPASGFGQFHPATLYWMIGDKDLGWAVLRECPPVDASAGRNRLAIRCLRGDLVFQVSAPGIDPARLGRGHWSVPGLELEVDTDATDCSVSKTGEGLLIRYRNLTRLTLLTRETTTPAP